MKRYIATIMIAAAGLTACNDFLDKEPLSSLSPEQFLTTETNIAAYATNLYAMLPVHGSSGYGTFTRDAHTDNMAAFTPSNLFAPGRWQVGQTGGSYTFTNIYNCNYFFDKVLEKVEAGEITGVAVNIDHYIGEVHFFRAFDYFNRLQALGDFPIVTTCLPNEMEALVEQSKRAPRTDVVRFILDDLDAAIELMLDNPPGGTNRLSKDCARLFKSRVALYEGTWLKYFNGTPFVPNGPGWPGAEANSGWEYPLGTIEREIEYLLSIAMEESKLIADKYGLVENTGTYQEYATDPANPYFNMFGDTDMSKYEEVLLWKAYDVGLGVVNGVGQYATMGNAGYGTTKSMLDAFIIWDGTPIYAAPTSGSKGYLGDDNILNITTNRDSRADIFFKKAFHWNLHGNAGSEGKAYETVPLVYESSEARKYTTGLTLRKGLNFDPIHTRALSSSFIGCIIFRATEAYLNYIEACYELTGTIDATADTYWREIRSRSKVDKNYNWTITATDMQIESQTDWGAWSAGQLVDATLFNIRRERRCELMAEGFRPMDIRRWRSMDQMIDTPYHVLGMNLWGGMQTWKEYYQDSDKSKPHLLVEGVNVSPRTFSTYMAPYRIMNNNNVYDGYRWAMAHYLDPIAVQHFLITGDGSVDASPLYQNPYWPTQAGQGALE